MWFNAAGRPVVKASLPILLSFLLCSCAETRFYENGNLVAVIQGDATNLTITTCNGSRFHCDSINHSIATGMVGNNVAKAIGSLGSTAIGIAGVVK